MKSTIFILLVVGFGNAFVAEALKCYACAGSKTSDCYNGKTSSMTIQTCPNLSSSSLHYLVYGPSFDSRLKEVCVSIVETNTTPDTYMKSCAVLPKEADDPCQFIKKQIPIISSCKYCTTDLCDPEAISEDDNIYDNTIDTTIFKLKSVFK